MARYGDEIRQHLVVCPELLSYDGEITVEEALLNPTHWDDHDCTHCDGLNVVLRTRFDELDIPDLPNPMDLLEFLESCGAIQINDTLTLDELCATEDYLNDSGCYEEGDVDLEEGEYDCTAVEYDATWENKDEVYGIDEGVDPDNEVDLNLMETIINASLLSCDTEPETSSSHVVTVVTYDDEDVAVLEETTITTSSNHGVFVWMELKDDHSTIRTRLSVSAALARAAELFNEDDFDKSIKFYFGDM